MNIETEMEWNSYMMKSGKVFGTYEFMIAKGHSWADINYVVWDVEDNTEMPLMKAASSALNTHPDILLKDVAQQTQASQPQDMRSAIDAQQVAAYNQRMEAQQAQGYNPKPTGAELMQAGKPVQATVAGVKNLFTGGAHSRGGALDAQAGSADGMKERYRLRDRSFLRPIRNLASKVQEGNDRRRQKRAGKSAMAAQRILDNEFAGMDPDNMSESERRRYDQQIALIAESNKMSGGTPESRMLNRTRQDRMKDKANADWEANTDPNKPAERPYPMRHQKVEAANNEGMGGAEQFGGEIDDPVEEDPITDTEAAEVEALGANIDEAALDDSLPKPSTDKPAAETGGKPQADEGGSWRDDVKEAYKSGGSRKNANEKVGAYIEGLGEGESATYDGLLGSMKGMRGAPREKLFNLLLSRLDITPKEAEKVAEKLEGDLAEETPAEEKFGGEIDEPAEQAFGGEIDDPAEEEELDDEDDEDNFLASYDETHAWDSLLKRLNVR